MNKEKIQNIYDYSKSKIEICNKLGIELNQNGITLDNIILKYFSQIGINSREEISKKKLSEHWLEIQKRDYNLNPKYCEYCGKILPFEKRNSKCCNQSCGSALGNKKKGNRSEETKRKISNTLKNNSISYVDLVIKFYNNELDFNYIQNNYPKLIKKCKNCGKLFIPKLRNYCNRISANKYCSEECKQKFISNHMSLLRQKEIQNGTFQGWKSRNITSYAENFWKYVLDNNDIKYIREQLVEYGNLGNGERYFLDFYIEHNGRKIDLEIDGKQHNYEDRKESDIRRDNYIKSLGIEVYRIKWNEINSENGKKIMKEKINNFLEYYKK